MLMERDSPKRFEDVLLEALRKKELTWPVIVAKLFSHGLALLGVMYLMGYVVVNGYQTSYMNYNASTLQLKHLTAGFLYAFLTFFQVGLTTSFLLQGVEDLQRDATKHKHISDKSVLDEPRWGRFTKYVRHVKSIARYLWVYATHLFSAALLITLFFGFIGYTNIPSKYGAIDIFTVSPLWFVINLLISVLFAFSIYQTARDFNKGISEAGSSLLLPSELVQAEQRALQRQYQRLLISGIVGHWIAKPFGFFLMVLFSLISFQGLYGHLKPDYGGGALYHVAVHLNPSSNLPQSLKDKVQARDSWLLLVDKDSQFVYLLSVEKGGARNLLEIPPSAINALEVLRILQCTRQT